MTIATYDDLAARIAAHISCERWHSSGRAPLGLRRHKPVQRPDESPTLRQPTQPQAMTEQETV